MSGSVRIWQRIASAWASEGNSLAGIGCAIGNRPRAEEAFRHLGHAYAEAIPHPAILMEVTIKPPSHPATKAEASKNRSCIASVNPCGRFAIRARRYFRSSIPSALRNRKRNSCFRQTGSQKRTKATIEFESAKRQSTPGVRKIESGFGIRTAISRSINRAGSRAAASSTTENPAIRSRPLRRTVPLLRQEAWEGPTRPTRPSETSVYSFSN